MTNRYDSDSIELMETIQTSFDHLLRENPMGQARKDALRLDFDRRLKLEFHGTKITSGRVAAAADRQDVMRELYKQ